MILDKFKLNGKTALITGCKRGIGRAIAIGLAEAGADIIGVSQSLEKKGSEVEKKVLEIGRKFKAYQCDFFKRKDLYDFIDKVKSENEIIDILINNAGMVLRKNVEEYPDEYWDKLIEVNLSSQFILTREFGKEMLKRRSGKIVFTASLLSFQGGITIPGYAASKGGLRTLTMAFSNEWASKGINVNAIVPGYIDTDNTKALKNDSIRNRQITERIPAGRWGVPDDFKGAVVFLCSDAADYVNGTMLVVDGGWLGR